jgi:hypothetical protein
MRSIPAQVAAALAARAIVERQLIWFTVRDRETGAPYSEGYWNDLGTVTAPVQDAETGLVVNRVFSGSGTLIEVDPIPAVSNLTIQRIEARLAQVSDRVNDLLRGYEPRQGKVQVYRALFDPNTRGIVDYAFPIFSGFIDEIVIPTPAEGGDGAVRVTLVSHTREITRSNPATRSDADQRRRSANDDFFKDVGVVGDPEVFWGVERR